MKTPAGKECKYFYGDYYRGRSHEECRLIKDSGIEWAPYLCQKCPVPDYLLANSCVFLQYSPHLRRPVFFQKPQVEVTAFCTKSNQMVKEPHIGCGVCHPGLEKFVVIPDDLDLTD